NILPPSPPFSHLPYPPCCEYALLARLPSVVLESASPVAISSLPRRQHGSHFVFALSLPRLPSHQPSSLPRPSTRAQLVLAARHRSPSSGSRTDPVLGVFVCSPCEFLLFSWYMFPLSATRSSD